MHLSLTLSTYIARQFLFGIGVVLIALLLLSGLIDGVELVRRASGHEGVTAAILAQMVLLRLPYLTEHIVPFAMLFGGMFTLIRLTRTNELVVARAAGVSVWQFLLPGLTIALTIGVFMVVAFNPLASATTWQFEQLEAKHLRGHASMLAVSSSGLWLREGNRDRQSVIHALRVSQEDMELHDVIIFVYEDEDRFVRRIDADTARLEDGYWFLRDATVSALDQSSVFYPEYRIETEMTVDQVHESFAPPETVSFWDLPGFIATLEAAGFSGLKHRLHWHSVLAIPLLLCAMILIAATFSLRLTRRGGTGLLVLGGVLAGFLLYLLTDVVLALGMSASIPVALAAWAPAGVFTLLGLAMLFHLEDG